MMKSTTIKFMEFEEWKVENMKNNFKLRVKKLLKKDSTCLK